MYTCVHNSVHACTHLCTHVYTTTPHPSATKGGGRRATPRERKVRKGKVEEYHRVRPYNLWYILNQSSQPRSFCCFKKLYGYVSFVHRFEPLGKPHTIPDWINTVVFVLIFSLLGRPLIWWKVVKRILWIYYLCGRRKRKCW